MNNLSWFDSSKINCGLLKNLCPSDEYRVIKPNELTGIIPDGLIQKADNILIMASGTATGTVIYMANINRVDEKDKAIDQEPFGLAFLSDDTTTSGCLIHHGNWDARTTRPPEEFWGNIAASGIGNCYPISEIPKNPSGSISELNISSKEGAFQAVCSKLRKEFCI
ncbi:MAG: hypothetical protein JXA46_14615 [Dehalococcoidales bacterium]|nr:hypothetical protein [Dehalococcoidales bacterium]